MESGLSGLKGEGCFVRGCRFFFWQFSDGKLADEAGFRMLWSMAIFRSRFSMNTVLDKGFFCYGGCRIELVQVYG